MFSILNLLLEKAEVYGHCGLLHTALDSVFFGRVVVKLKFYWDFYGHDLVGWSNVSYWLVESAVREFIAPRLCRALCTLLIPAAAWIKSQWGCASALRDDVAGRWQVRWNFALPFPNPSLHHPATGDHPLDGEWCEKGCCVPFQRRQTASFLFQVSFSVLSTTDATRLIAQRGLSSPGFTYSISKKGSPLPNQMLPITAQLLLAFPGSARLGFCTRDTNDA